MTAKKMTGQEIRQKFLDYFTTREASHTVVTSSSLIPSNDPTLLFTNAGMVQFKDVFLGLEKKQYTRAVSVQRCIRAGGKHNDLENVGYTARHHTFFEMLGNFSFGDYFKEAAIQYAWDFLTNHLKLPKEKLWITVYEKDLESEKIWIEKIGLPPERIIRCGEKDNFWSMGETGPCGPCSEIFYDHGESIWGGLPNTPEADGDRYIEIWNLVFMQYQRHSDGSLTPLPKPSVDTGMGLERMAAVLQGVHNNYETDLFAPIIAEVNKLSTEKSLSPQVQNVLADHIRSSSFLILDGIMPSNEGRGYVLRRIIRRAIRHGVQAGISSSFFYRLVKPFVHIMMEAYPELTKAQNFIEKTLQHEEQQFSSTLDQGLKILQHEIQHLAENEIHQKVISGKCVFKLYDTYGFPVDLTADVARENGFVLNMKEFEVEMENQRQLSKTHQKFSAQDLNQASVILENKDGQSIFTGYEFLEESSAKVTALLKNKDNRIHVLILDKTPFYAESGGQVGDQGIIESSSGKFHVIDTRKIGQHIAHYGEMISGNFVEGETVHAKVDAALRQAIVLNHTATHLLHAALRKILGNHVEQKGSLVAPDRLRFDFSHPEALTFEKIEQLESLVNQQIRMNNKSEKNITTPDEAIQSGAMALFGEKYGDEVRTLKLGDFSYEVCGGTHVNYTGEIGLFKIISETGIASGVRRIEAVTGKASEEWVLNRQKILDKISQLFKSSIENIADKSTQLLDQQKQMQKDLELLQSQLIHYKLEDIIKNQKVINGVTFLSGQLDKIDGKVLREACDMLKQKIQSGVIVLGSIKENKPNIIVGVTKDLLAEYQANQLIQPLAELIGGKGGGRPDLAQAGGDKPEKLIQALEYIYKI